MTNIAHPNNDAEDVFYVIFNHLSGTATEEEEEMYDWIRSASLPQLPESDYVTETDSSNSAHEHRLQGFKRLDEEQQLEHRMEMAEDGEIPEDYYVTSDDSDDDKKQGKKMFEFQARSY